MSNVAGQRTVEAEQFVLKDSKGKTRAILGTQQEEPFLALLDPTGKPRAAVAIHGEDPHLLLYDRLGQPKLRLSVRGDWPELGMCDWHGHPETSLSMSKHGTFLSLGGPPGAQNVYMNTGRDGASLVFRQYARGNGGSWVRLRVPKSGPILTFHATTGGPRLELSVRTQKPVFAFLDKKGKRIMSVSVVGGKPIVQVRNNGRIRVIRLADIDAGEK
jgi:hypothetical protein